MHLAPAGEGPFRYDYRLPAVVVEGALGEPGFREVDEAPVVERIPLAGGDLKDDGAVRVRSPGGDGDDRRHDEIDRDDVYDSLRHARELSQQPAGEGDDHRLGHPKAADPARSWLAQGRLDDRWPDEGDGEIGPRLEEGPLAERFRIGIGVRPAERLRPAAAGVHHSMRHPVLANSLGLVGEERRPGRPELCPCAALKLSEAVGSAALGIGIRPRPAGGGHLGPPVGLGEPAARGYELLGRIALVSTVDIGGGDGDEMGEAGAVLGAERSQRLGHPRRAEQVDRHGAVEGSIEADSCRRVDDDVARGEQGRSLSVESEAVVGSRRRRWRSAVG